MSKQKKGKASPGGRQVSHDVGHASDGRDAVSVSSTGPLAGKLSWLPPYNPKLDSKNLEWTTEEPPEGDLVVTVSTIEEALEELEALPGWRSDEQ